MSKKHKEENIYEATYDEMSKFESFFVSHWRKIVQTCGAALTVLILYLVFNYFNQISETKAAGEISQANTVEELNAIISKYSSHPAVDFAKVRLAQILFNDKKYDEAQKIYIQLSFSKYPDISLRAKLNQAYLMEVQGKKNEAATIFSEISGTPGMPEEIRAESAYNAARIYGNLGEKDKSKKVLEFLNRTAETAKSEAFWSEKAKRLKEMMN